MPSFVLLQISAGNPYQGLDLRHGSWGQFDLFPSLEHRIPKQTGIPSSGPDRWLPGSWGDITDAFRTPWGRPWKQVDKCISCSLKSTLGKEWFILIWFFLLISQFLKVFQAFLMAKSTVMSILEMFWSQPWHTLRMKGSFNPWFTKERQTEGPVSWSLLCEEHFLEHFFARGHVTGFVGSSFPDQGLTPGTLAVKAHRQGIPYWVTADITADASALLRLQVMGEMNHQDNQAQKRKFKKRKEGKKRKAKNPARAVCCYTTERMRKNRILEVYYIISCIFLIINTKTRLWLTLIKTAVWKKKYTNT